MFLGGDCDKERCHPLDIVKMMKSLKKLDLDDIIDRCKIETFIDSISKIQKKVHNKLLPKILSEDCKIQLCPGVDARINVFKCPFKDIITVNGIPIVSDIKSFRDMFQCEDFIDIMVDKGCLLTTSNSKSILEKLKVSPDYSILVQAIELFDQEIIDIINKDKITLFAPNDDAFRFLAESLNITVSKLLSNTSFIKKLLLDHIIEKTLFSEAFPKKKKIQIETVGKNKITVLKSRHNNLYIKTEHITAKSITKDNLTTNGVIHTIDRVIIV